MQNEILVGRFNGILAKLFGMKERAPSPVVAAEIIPTIVLESDRPEFKFIGGERLGMAGGPLTSAVGELSSLTIFNSPGSGVLVVLEKHITSSTSSQRIVMGLVTTAPAAIGADFASRHRDFRQSTVIGPSVGIVARVYDSRSAVSLVAAPGYFSHCPAGNLVQLDTDIILPPGTGIVSEATVANANFNCGWRWRERILEPSETR